MICILLRGVDLSASSPPALNREQSHHLANVLRLKTGAPVRILNGAGASRLAEITDVAKHQVAYEFRGGVETLPQAAAQITLFQCVAKAARMDWLIEKATELAVARVVPVISERTICALDSGESPVRWTRIAEAALCQCGGGYLPEISGAAKWNDALAQIRDFIASGGVVFVGALTPDAPSLGAELSVIFDGGVSAPPRVAFVIGPEGDLSPAEYESVFAAGARPVSFGAQVLRVETAAIFAVCAAQAFALK